MSKSKYFPKGTIANMPAGVEFQMPAADTADVETAPVVEVIEPEVIAPVVEEPVVTQEPEVAVKPALVIKPEPVVVVEQPTAVEAVQEKGKTDMNVQHQLERYAEAMAVGKPVPPKEGGMHQYGLYKLIKTILATEDQAEFTTKFNTLLNFIKDNTNKVFSEAYVYRFPEHWTGSESEFTNFRRILMVIIATADSAKRNINLATINMEKALEGFTEKEKNRVIVFFNL